jgi:hypothetical protein
VIKTEFFSTLMAVDGDINSKNPKTLSPRELLDEEREKVTLFCKPGHMIIPVLKSQTKKQKLPWKMTSYSQKNTHHKI